MIRHWVPVADFASSFEADLAVASARGVRVLVPSDAASAAREVLATSADE
jgi:hypothetical protein